MKRTRTQTQRFGTASLICDLSGDDEPFGDNSFDDKDFEPTSKNQKTIEENDQSVESSKIDNFDEEFEVIARKTQFAPSVVIDELRQSTTDVESSQKHSNQIENLDSLDQADLKALLLKCIEQLNDLKRGNSQILFRITVIEESMMRNGTLMTIKHESNQIDKFETFNSFINKLNFPLTNISDMNKFEENLQNETTNKAAINALSCFPGMDLSNRTKHLKKLVYTIFDPIFLSNFTWTGKAPNGQTKIAFNKLGRIVQLLYSIISKVDAGYTYEMFVKNLKEGILKYAHG